MSTFVYADNAISTLAAGIASGDTTGTLALGTGALFPALASGQVFTATLIPNATTFTPTEIVYVTAISGDVITMMRGQEGTNAGTWATGSVISNNLTAGALNNFEQSQNQVLPGVYNFAKGAIIGPSFDATYSHALPSAPTAGRYLAQVWLNINGTFGQAATLDITNSVDSSSNGDVIQGTQVQCIAIDTPLGVAPIIYAQITTPSGSYDETTFSLDLSYTFTPGTP